MSVRKPDVPITVVYEIDCRVCGEAVWPDERITSREQARELRDAHIAEHEGRAVTELEYMLERCTFAVVPDSCTAPSLMPVMARQAARQLEAALAARSALRYGSGYSMNLGIRWPR